MQTKKKILVTGATGFFGNEIVSHLLNNYQVEVIASDYDASRVKQCSWNNQVKFIEYNLKSHKENLFKTFEEPDCVIHLSWAGLPNYNKLFHIEENLIHNIHFLKSLAESGLKRITIAGTCMEYGIINGQLSENTPTNPNTPYSLAKDTLRRYLEFLAADLKFEYRWVRIFYMLSNRQDNRGIIAQLDAAISKGEKEFSLSGGEQLRDFLSTQEIVKIICKIALQDKENGIFNCCSGKPTSIKTIVQEHVKKLNADIRLNFGVYPYPEYEPMAFWGDNTKLLKVIQS